MTTNIKSASKIDNQSFRRRRKKIKLYPGHPSDEELISAFLANQGTITKCPPGRALGSLQSTCHGLDKS